MLGSAVNQGGPSQSPGWGEASRLEDPPQGHQVPDEGQMDKSSPNKEQEAEVWGPLAKKSWKGCKADCTGEPPKEGPLTSEGRLPSPQHQPESCFEGGCGVGRLA